MSFKHLFTGQSPLAYSGFFLIILGSLGAFFRELPQYCLSWLTGQFTMMLTVKDDDAAFSWVKEWFLQQEFVGSLRQLDLDTTLRGEEPALMPAPGTHFFRYGGRPFWVYFHRSEDTKARTQRRMESLTFRTIGRDQAVIRRFVEEVAACHRVKARVSSF